MSNHRNDNNITELKTYFNSVIDWVSQVAVLIPNYLKFAFLKNQRKKATYAQQTDEAKIAGKSNCPLCALGGKNNSKRIWKYIEMDADHVTAWSKGGATDKSNCQMLCKIHNSAKGNK